MDSIKITSFFTPTSLPSNENTCDAKWNCNCNLPVTSLDNLVNSGSLSSSKQNYNKPTGNNKCLTRDAVKRRKLSLKRTKKCETKTLTPRNKSSVNEESVNVKQLKSKVQKGQTSLFTYLQAKHVSDDKSIEKENKIRVLSVVPKCKSISDETGQAQDTAVILTAKMNMTDHPCKLSDDAVSHSERCSVDFSNNSFQNNFLDELNESFFEEFEKSASPKGKMRAWLDTINIDNDIKEGECFEVKDICCAQRGKVCLLLKSKESSVKRICILQGFWLNTIVQVGDIVRVLAEFLNGCATINDEHGLLIVNPDQLVSTTTVVSTLFCMRKSVLAEKFPGWDAGNKSMLLGTLIHQLFQETVQKQEPSENLEEVFSSLLKKPGNLHAIYAKKSNELEMESEASNYLSNIIDWKRMYLNPYYARVLNDNKNGEVQVLSVVDIEDNIWCPYYGIRGKVDLTSEVVIHNRRKCVPIELKTGHPTFSFEHQGQVALYSMMMSHRKGDVCNEGFLLYLKNGPEMKAVHQHHTLQRDLVQLRNEIAYYLNSSNVTKESSGTVFNVAALPEPKNNKRSCQKCPFLLPCTMFQRIVENSKPSDTAHAMHVLVPETTKHLSSSHLNYFKHWFLLLQLEKQSSHDALQQAFWKENSYQREKEGLCFANMSLHSPDSYDDSLWPERSYIHTFRKSNINLLNIGLQPLDYVIASLENHGKVITIAAGEIIRITEEAVDVILDKNLYQKPDWSLDSYRLDKMSSGSAMNINLITLLHLMKNDAESDRARKLLIDCMRPLFVPVSKLKLHDHPMLSLLNDQQLECIMKVLSSSDYVLIKGMPGTGKTSTLVILIRFLVKMGNSVLLTSYTHSALDNILIRLKQHNVDFIRLGRQSRIHHDIKPYSAELLTKRMLSVKELDNFYKSKKVVCTTCLGISHPIFQHRNFDICIVDEASQILQPACIGPLLHAKKFVLVGDPQQLPPVVKSREARLLGMSESLFSRLQTNENTVELNVQYRMNKEITRLCNALMYHGLLKCGSPNVEYSTLHLPSTSNLPNSFSWHKSVLSSRLCDSVLLLNTDSIPGEETYDIQGLVQNEAEIEIIVQLIWVMIKAGLAGKDIGVISPYKKQVHLLQDSLRMRKLLHIEVNTVDQYQGRDKPVILISCVRSFTGSKVAELLEDERRLNVAISRAKHKLLIIGSKHTLINYIPFKKLITALREKQIVDVPKAAIARFWKEADKIV